MRVDVVIGANYGDEGKGQTVSDLIRKSECKRKAVVRFNGGPNAGHTVEVNGSRFVFSAWCSGTPNADTILLDSAVIDPFVSCSERRKLRDVFGNVVDNLQYLVDSKCRIVTPYDVAYNRYMVQNVKNSTGHGIFATIDRSKTVCMLARDLEDESAMLRRLNMVAHYYNEQLRGHNVSIQDLVVRYVSSEYEDRLFINMINNDFRRWATITTCVRSHVKHEYDHVVFEGAQGLCIGEQQSCVNTTPSDTGVGYVANFLLGLKYQYDVTVHYATRPFLTRHGDGDIVGECSQLLNQLLESYDDTNIPNAYQGSMRASILDVDELATRVIADFRRIKYPMLGGNVVPVVKVSCSWLHVFDDHLIPIVSGGHAQRVSRAGWIDAIVLAFKKQDQFVHVFELTDHKIFVDLNKKSV